MRCLGRLNLPQNGYFQFISKQVQVVKLAYQ